MSVKSSISSHACEDIISSHVRISYRFYQFLTTRYTTDFYIIAELRRQAEPHTHIKELKGTHEVIFSCVPWLAVLLVGAYAHDDDGGGVAQNGGHTPIID